MLKKYGPYALAFALGYALSNKLATVPVINRIPKF
jgi:hypothetical protein